MNPTTIDPTAITHIINMLPLSASVRETLANIVAIGTALIAGVQGVMMALPVATASSPIWYKNLFGTLARLSLNLGKNAPVPANGDAPAGGLVPVHPVQQPTLTGTKIVETAPVKAP